MFGVKILEEKDEKETVPKDTHELALKLIGDPSGHAESEAMRTKQATVVDGLKKLTDQIESA